MLTDIETEVEFLTALPSREVLHDLGPPLATVPGIIELRGDGRSVTVVHDTQHVTPVRIREAFVELGYVVRGGTEIVDPGAAAD